MLAPEVTENQDMCVERAMESEPRGSVFESLLQEYTNI